jgi:aryl-alcohol dehydrogenase-like predicted oxidoreductase
MQLAEIPGVRLPVPRLVQGTLRLPRLTDDDAFALLDSLYEHGARAFDTAPVYGMGRAEALLAAWIRARGVRESVVVIDKGAHPDTERRRVTPRDIANDAAQSFDVMGSCIDLYLLQRDDPAVPVSEIVDALNEQKRAGLVDSFGASNWTHERIEAANAYAINTNQLGFVASSPELNLCEPVRTWPGCLSIGGPSGRAARAWYRDSKLAVLAWSPVAGGFLGGRFTRESCATPQTPYERRVADFYASEANFARLDRLRELASRRGMPLGVAALGYVAGQKLNTFAIIGADSATEFRECERGLEVRLEPAEIEWLENEVAR